ncbi:MAG: multicopper oxidase domain-containing protein [Proteobacteria bacterium]|nr:multicopper oxidase domain-containing protein [Pseudomonadota bacterium]
MTSRQRPATSRRHILEGAGAFVMACALPPLAEAQVKAGADKPMAEKPAPRRFSLRAEAYKARLGDEKSPLSDLMRLTQPDAPTASFPVLRLRAGTPFEIEVENALNQPLALHLRGMRGPNSADGTPVLTREPVPPGGKQIISLPGTQAGTFILQPVLPESVAEQNARGLFAVVIVEEAATDTSLFDHDLVLAFSDWRLDDKGALAGDFLALEDAARLGRLGNKLAVNNAPAPAHLDVRPGARIRVRMVNVANARVVPIKVAGYPAQVFAIDSTPCQPFDPLKRTVIMAPATRIELVLQAPQEAGVAGAVQARLGDGLPLYTFKTVGTPIPPRGALAALPDPGLPPAIRLQDAVRKSMAIEGGIGTDPKEAEQDALRKRFPAPRSVFVLSSPPNGSEIFGGYTRRPVAKMKKGAVFVLTIENRTAWPQVIGVHGHAFRLLHAYDDGWEPYFLDTLYMAPRSKAILALVADNPGKWAIRSTLAEHYGTGVATWFEVT